MIQASLYLQSLCYNIKALNNLSLQKRELSHLNVLISNSVLKGYRNPVLAPTPVINPALAQCQFCKPFGSRWGCAELCRPVLSTPRLASLEKKLFVPSPSYLKQDFFLFVFQRSF